MGLTSSELGLVDLIKSEAMSGVRDRIDRLSEEQKDRILPALLDALQSEERLCNIIWERDYKEIPVGIEEFIHGKDYLYNYAGDDWWDTWTEELKQIFDEERSIIEWIITGPIGGGKSFTAVMALAYMMYRLCCMRQPQQYYGLAKGSKISFALFNTSLASAKMVAYGYMRSALLDSPFFQRVGLVETRLGMFVGKNLQVYPASNIRHALGMNLFGGLLDELNFLKQSDKYNSYAVYTQTKRRMESRYQKMGKVPGMLVMVSSRKDMTDFLENHIEKSRNDPHVMITDKPLWHFKPDRYSTKRFRVVVGNMYNSSRVVDTVVINEHDIEQSDVIAGEVREGDKVVEIPIDHYESFLKDIDGSLRDLAGVATYSTSPLIPNREFVTACETEELTHPFTKEELSLGIFDKANIEDFFLPSVMFIEKKLRRHPEELRFGHIDIGVTGDAYGLSIAHFAGTKEVKGTNSLGQPFVMHLPVVEIDFMLRVTVSTSEVDLTKPVQFLMYLKESGMAFDGVTLDGYQSRHTMQMLLKNGIYSEILSMDRKDEQYLFFRSVVMDKRLSVYHYDRFFVEAVSLIHHVGGKHTPPVDHPENMIDSKGKLVKGSKDITDSVAGCVYSICKKYEKSSMDDFARLNPPFRRPAKDEPLGEPWVRGKYNDKRKLKLRGGDV